MASSTPTSPANLPSPTHLIVLTNHYPFGRGEAFLDEEFPSLLQKFDKVAILTKNTIDLRPRRVGDFEIVRVAPRTTPSTFIRTLTKIIVCAPSILSLLRREISSTGSMRFLIMKQMFHDLFKAVEKSIIIQDIIRRLPEPTSVVLYSYWLDSTALATLLVRSGKHNITRVSRAHGGDLYEYRQPHQYLSFRSALIARLDRIFTISLDGKQHLENLAAKNKTKARGIEVARLGTKPGVFRDVKLSPPYLLVSCSFIVAVKRIHLVIKALSHLDIPVRWVHIGDGPLRRELEHEAAQVLGLKRNIGYDFRGYMNSDALRSFYRDEHVHAFINTSESEGIPVTMMEAQSFGVPCIAPQVGGIPELLSEESGFLFPKNATPVEIALCIEQMFTQSPGSYQTMRHRSLANWNDKFNAEKNFPTFADKLLALTRYEI